MSQTILITGAAGRIGSLLARRLANAGRILRLVDLQSDDTRSIKAVDIRDPVAVARAMDGVDVVVHLAGHPNSRDWATVEDLNMRGARVVFEAAVGAGARRILYASSIHVVGLHPADAALTSTMTLAPDGPYGVSKAYGEMLLNYICRTDGLSGTALRICSFRPEPTNARELRTWISPDDMVRLADACLTTAADGFRIVWGVSANRRAVVDREAWRDVGYAPADEAENFVDMLSSAGVDTDRVSEWPCLGAHFVAPGITPLDRITPPG